MDRWMELQVHKMEMKVDLVAGKHVSTVVWIVLVSAVREHIHFIRKQARRTFSSILIDLSVSAAISDPRSEHVKPLDPF